MSNEKGPDHSRRKERSRQAIFAATRALVAEEAYEKVTVEAIAARRRRRQADDLSAVAVEERGRLRRPSGSE